MKHDLTEIVRHPSFTMGLTYQKLGNLRRARLLYRTEIRRTGFYKAYFNLALLLSESRRFREAVALFRRAAAKATARKDIADALCEIGTAYEELGRNDDALAMYTAAARRNPKSSHALFRGAIHLFRQGERKLGLRWLDRAYRRRHADPEATKNVAYALVEFEVQPKRAVRLLKRWLTSHHADAEAWSDLALAYHALGEQKRSKGAARKALRLASADPEIRKRVSVVLGNA